jgi:hypothetical protein
MTFPIGTLLQVTAPAFVRNAASYRHGRVIEQVGCGTFAIVAGGTTEWFVNVVVPEFNVRGWIATNIIEQVSL